MKKIAVLLIPVLAAFAQKEKEDTDFFKRWLSEDAAYILSKEESQAAKGLRTPEEKETFIQQFWERRDPTPGTLANELKDEHYRRIAYANEHYTTATDGWRTDRGKMYIRFGAPDSVDRSSQTTHTQMVSGARRWTVPYETWDYRNLPGIGPVKLTFVDRTMSGYYELTMNPEDKIAKFSNEDNAIYSGNMTNFTAVGETPDSDVFTRRLQQYIAVQRPPEIRFKDLQEIVNVRLTFNTLNYAVRHDVLRGLGEKSLVPITYEFDMDGLPSRTVDARTETSLNVYGLITNIAGRAIAEFEDGVKLINGRHYQRFVTLDPGRYKLTTVVKDPSNGNVGTREQVLNVPRRASKLSSSSLILADLLVPAAPNEQPLDNFVINRYKVRPLVSDSLSRKSPLGVYLEIYGYATDPATLQPRIEGELQVLEKGPGQILSIPLSLEDMSARYNDRILFVRSLDIKDFAPGTYTVRLRLTDKLKNDTLVIEKSATIRE